MIASSEDLAESDRGPKRDLDTFERVHRPYGMARGSVAYEDKTQSSGAFNVISWGRLEEHQWRIICETILCSQLLSRSANTVPYLCSSFQGCPNAIFAKHV